MTDSYSLSDLNSYSFENMVNAICIKVLGSGHTGFGPGADGGRDGFFEGVAIYPNETEKWSGKWYIQSKFHKPHLSTDAQKWLLKQIEDEIKLFNDPQKKRKWPDNWIICSNIDQSGVPETGVFDKARQLVTKANPALENRFHIWGGRKILDFLNEHIRKAYGHFLTPGHVLTEIKEWMGDDRATIEEIIRTLVVKQFGDQQHTRLEQAGSDTDTRPGVHQLFIDVPFFDALFHARGLAIQSLTKAASRSHRVDKLAPESDAWMRWNRYHERAKVWFVRGGPGQGKSTMGQFFCQTQRAAFILSDEAPVVPYATKSTAREVEAKAKELDIWPSVPRVPMFLELQEYAHWYGRQTDDSPKGVLTFLASKLTAAIEKDVKPGTLERALQKGAWVFVFDGLDEVPSDSKDPASAEIRHFIDEVALRNDCDLLSICTTRPQGYSGQFQDFHCAQIMLTHLSPEQAIQCAKPVLRIGRSDEEAKKSLAILQIAVTSPGVRELMQTPLQSHIMAVVVRDGGKPPERRWQLFNNFYEVIRRREANKEFVEPNLERLMRENEQLLRSIHNRLGFTLHSSAETSQGATTSLSREQFQALASTTVEQMVETNKEAMVDVLTQATEHRLVLVNTPDDGSSLRFDVRQLQEFFAAEFLYESVDAHQLQARIRMVAGDPHWREVMHFLFSALVEKGRSTELTSAIRVLEEVNEGDPSTPSRAFHRRMGAGSAIAERLLAEGVLEQDRRVRNHFKNAIEPLFAQSTTAKSSLLGLTKSNSRAWLVSCLLEQIKESDSSESIGGASLLAKMLDQEDAELSNAIELIMSKGTSYFDGIVACLSASKSPSTKLWFNRLLMRRLLKFDKKSLSVDVCTRILTLIGQMSFDSFATLCEDFSLSRFEATVFAECCPEGSKISNDLEPRFKTELVKHGSITGRYLANDWSTTTSDQEEGKENIEVEGKGFLSLALAIEQFDQVRSRGAFISVINELMATEQPLLSVLSSVQRSRFPALDRNSPLARIKESAQSNDDEQFSAALSNCQLGDFKLRRWAVTFTVDKIPEPNSELKRLIDENPTIAVLVWFAKHHRNSTTRELRAQHKTVRADFRKQFCKSPGMVEDFSEVLGEVLDDEESDTLRHRLIGTELDATFLGHPYWFEISPFKVFLPSESNLLPLVLRALVRSGLNESGQAIEENSDGLQVAIGAKRFYENKISEYGLDVDSLISSASNQESPLFVRASAVLLAALHDQGNFDLIDKNSDMLLECARSRFKVIIIGLTRVLTIVGSPGDRACRQFVGRLFDTIKNDYPLRNQVQALLNTWREQSLAPVSESNVAGLWLNGTD